jgi:hypothetical protein
MTTPAFSIAASLASMTARSFDGSRPIAPAPSAASWSYELTVEDLADTRFAISPVGEASLSIWALRDPGRYALHLPWLRSIIRKLDPSDTRLLLSLVGQDFALPDFITPLRPTFAATFEEELATVRATPPEIVRRDLQATHAPHPLPDALLVVDSADDAPVRALRESICDALERHWRTALAPSWPQIRVVLEGDMTYRARQLAKGGARLLFADIHPNLRWRDGVLYIDEMIGAPPHSRFRPRAAAHALDLRL